MRKINNQAGFTFIEVVLWIAITTLLMAAIFGVFSVSTRLWLRGDAQYDIQQIARLTTNSIISELKYGSAYQVLTAFNGADANEAIQFTSRKDSISYIYYVSNIDRHLYRSPGYNGPMPELVPGQAVQNHLNDIQINTPLNETMFSLQGTSSVNISFVITDIRRDQICIIRTTVTDIGVIK